MRHSDENPDRVIRCLIKPLTAYISRKVTMPAMRTMSLTATFAHAVKITQAFAASAMRVIAVGRLSIVTIR